MSSRLFVWSVDFSRTPLRIEPKWVTREMTNALCPQLDLILFLLYRYFYSFLFAESDILFMIENLK